MLCLHLCQYEGVRSLGAELETAVGCDVGAGN